MYADYTYYQESFYGNAIAEADWPKYATKASDFIDYLTWKKAQNNAELTEVKKCCCALAERYKAIEALQIAASAKVTEDGIISSETVGSHSRSFRNGAEGAQAIVEYEKELSSIVRRYLLPTGLLYRGGVALVHSAHSNSV